MLFKRENDFNDAVKAAADYFNVSPSLIKGIIAQESQFNPQAYRAEPKINDGSRGLMQILLKTARGLGYTGAPDGLYNPATNVWYGTRFLRDLVNGATSHGYGLDSAISAYNGGVSAQRPGDGKRTGSTVDTPFINKTYVDNVLRYAKAYEIVSPPVASDAIDTHTGNATNPPTVKEAVDLHKQTVVAGTSMILVIVAGIILLSMHQRG